MTIYTEAEQREHRRLWVEALRSGKYQQARGQLREGQAFCCLGVACEISGLGVWEDASEFPDYIIGDEYARPDLLPDPVREWLGLASDDGLFKGPIVPITLIGKNDHDKATFDEIADIIESEPSGLITTPSQAA